ncbi:MAG TPA: YciI family protein [Baekduia sp.]|uniref:YciI family protein n=1 Tax=Baekduia sp. TaxID=2600305 RepID=UPI002C0D42CA|nr:YciI family protein [Baekduia sp.]HMJ36077.1 YciI family protein [Baekduia sp.]
MRYMLFIYPGESYEGQTEPSVEDVGAMSRFNEELTKAGVLLSLDGLHPASEGARVTFSGGGSSTVTDGPFTEAKELVGGYWIIQAKSKEEAVEWATRVPAGAGDMVEVRRVYEMSDFSPEVQAAGELSEVPPGQTFAE